MRLPDGRVVSNKTGLCVRHHDMVTGMIGGHQARIEWVAGVFYWHDLANPVADGPLFPQPLGLGEKENPEKLEMHPHRSLAEGETCPECGYTKPQRREPGPRRRAKSWAVTVPDDAEDGAEILDALVEDFAAVLGLDRESKRLLRYHVLVPVMFWASQHLPQFIHDVREAAGGNGRPR